ncbi:hypothetical protein CR513_59860, partial [Mucuna pruriens]
MFPNLRKSKFLPRGDGPFNVFKRINGPYLRTNSFKEEEHDMNMDMLGKDTHEGKESMKTKALQGPMTRGRMRKLEEEMYNEISLLMGQR